MSVQPVGRQPLFILLILTSILAACQTPNTPLPTQPKPVVALPQPTDPPSTAPSPTDVPRPTRTPKPTPTLPAVDEMRCIPLDGERVSGVVAGVIDGDTITVQVGITSFTVRYLGVDTPETNVTPPERMGPEAKARNRELVSGKRAILVADPEADDIDRYNRLLRYVIVGDVFVNYQLVREGLARYYASEFSCGPTIFQAEQDARADDVGLWGPILNQRLAPKALIPKPG
ncbi:MAG: thermonuclease family protein, partial [Anaerolineales bacterium]